MSLTFLSELAHNILHMSKTYTVRKRLVREIVYTVTAETRIEAAALADELGGNADVYAYADVAGAVVTVIHDDEVRRTIYVNGTRISI